MGASIGSIVLGVLLVVGLGAPDFARAGTIHYPDTPRIPVSDTLHGTVVVDPYRWLEDGKNAEVLDWTAQEEGLARSILDSLPQRPWCIARLEKLWRYDDEGTPDEVIDGDRIFYWVKKKEDEKARFWTKASIGGPGREILNPNAWDAIDQLSGFYPSRDGRYVAFGRAKGGNESPVIRVMEVETGRILPDSLRGWRQGGISWLPGNAGFYYSANPRKGEVPEGEEAYWSTAWYHRLGNPSSEDRVAFRDPKVKETFSGCWPNEEASYLMYGRWLSHKNEVYFQRLGDAGPPTPIATGFDGEYQVEIIGKKIYITTDKDAPMMKVMVTDVDHPERESWKELIPENKEAKLTYVAAVAGRFFAVYEVRAHTVIKVFDPDGRFLRDLPLPTIGSAWVRGYWSKPRVWVSFSSFFYPPVTYTYDFDADSLVFYKKFPVDVDVTPYTVEQVWYPSKDGTRISMFLLRGKDLEKNGANPTLLTGYGGFNASMTPYFSATYLSWLEAGGMVAIPNLRGGGEYGTAWHEAGRLEKKQNVFDDFIAAAEWLIASRYTSPSKLAIQGGSNGGLLVGAATVQRPDLFRAVLCEVPLLDMVRYHKFGYANIWAEEYGSSEDPDQFRYLLKYSPYHGIVEGKKYPAMLIVGSENDARVDPLHARKMAARMQAADQGGGPILVLVQKESGHGGGTTLTTTIEQRADGISFLMDQLGMVPK